MLNGLPHETSAFISYDVVLFEDNVRVVYFVGVRGETVGGIGNDLHGVGGEILSEMISTMEVVCDDCVVANDDLLDCFEMGVLEMR